MWEILAAIGVLGTASSVDLIAADGFERTFTPDELKKSWPQGTPVMGLSTAEGWRSQVVT